MKRLLKFLKFAFPILAIVLLISFFGGCIPMPHTTERSPEIHGRILDANSHTPIQGAKIFLSGHPNILSVSDTNGNFQLKATRNFHLGSTPPEGNWPKGEYWGAAI